MNANYLNVQVPVKGLVEIIKTELESVLNTQKSVNTKVDENPYLTPNEVCEILKVSIGALRNWRIKKILEPHHKIGRKVFYLKSDVLNYKSNNTK